MKRKVIAQTKHITILHWNGYNSFGNYIKHMYTVIWNDTSNYNVTFERYKAFDFARSLVKNPIS